MDLESIGGNGPDEIVGSFSGLNDDSGSLQDDDGVDRVSVREVWLQSFLLDERLRLVVGKIDLTNYFDSNTVANDETTQFITSAFVNNPTLEVPVNGPGLLAFFDTRKGLTIGLGLQSLDNSGTNITDDIYGIAEIGYRSHFFFEQEGIYRLWGRTKGGMENNNGFGVSIDQNLSTRLTAFARYGANESEVDDATIASAWSAGLRLRSPFFSRVNDEVAFAFGMLDVVDGDEESAAELYYKFQVNDQFAITPSFQVVFDPAGRGSNDTASVIGIRTQLEF
jgi:carbohydrate-selective porin OprB